MPLLYSASDAARSRNIATLIREGKPAKQAVAIAYSIQRKAKPSRGKTRVAPHKRSAPKRKKRTRSPAQLAVLAQKPAAAMAARRKGSRKAPARAKPDRNLTVRPKRRNIQGMRSSARRKGRRSSKSRAMVHGHAKSRARSAVRHVGATLGAEKHRTGALMVAAGLGFAKKQGYEIPHVETVGEAGTIALAAFFVKRFGVIRSPWLDHLITGAGVIAIYEAVSTGNIPLLSSSTAKKAKTEGDDVDGAYHVD